MKKIIVSFLAMAAFVFSANAQGMRKMNCQHKHHHHQHQRGIAMKQLNFSEDQKKQLKEYRIGYKKQMQELNKNENITVKEYRDRKEAMHKDQKAKMQSLLTVEQKNKLEEIKKERKQKHAMMQAKKLDKMKINLGLTNDQVAKIKAQRETTHAKIKALKGNESLGRVEKQEQLMALKNENKGSFKKFLTQEQLTRMEETKKKKMENLP